MGTVVSRAQFLRGDYSGRSTPIRPPWSLPEAKFTDLCNRCGDCIGVCPQHILEKGRGGFPRVDFSRGECLFCSECVQVCTTGALAVNRHGSNALEPWSVRASIGERCLADHGVECRSCGDQCESSSIRFQLVVGGVAKPMLEQSACSGCGACYRVCPVQAIELRQSNSNRGIQA